RESRGCVRPPRSLSTRLGRLRLLEPPPRGHALPWFNGAGDPEESQHFALAGGGPSRDPQEASMNPIPAARIVIPEEDRRQILAHIDEALRTGALTLGQKGQAFETAFARIVGARFAVAVQSGTSALEIILRSLGVEGREVVVPTNTFFAPPAAGIHAGRPPRFGDVERGTLGLSVESVAAAVSSETAAVILVHIAGLVSPETPGIAAFCRERGLFLVEDAAHAHASTLDGRMAGTFGTA